MGVYTFSCRECNSRFDSESPGQWAVDQSAQVACQVGKRPKCTVYCVGEAVQQPVQVVATSATPTISLSDDPAINQRIAYLEMQTIDGGIGRLSIGEGLIQTYGRKSDFDVCDHPIETEDRKMSRLHFQIESRMHNNQPSYILSDLGSVHGTRVMRQIGNTTGTVELYTDKEDQKDQDGICLAADDLVIAGSTILRFTAEVLETPAFRPNNDTPLTPFDPNKTVVF